MESKSETKTDRFRDRARRLQSARLYVLVDGRESAEEFDRLVTALVSVDVSVLQLRDKRHGDRELLERAHRLRAATRHTGTLFVMNDRPDLAVLADADGVHVGQDELGVTDVRVIAGPDVLIGVSTHSIEQARRAVADGADYIGVGPTFPSSTKRFDAFPGIDLLRTVAAEIDLPGFAIGGIDIERLPQILESGMQRVAVGHAITSARDPSAAAQSFQQLLPS